MIEDAQIFVGQAVDFNFTVYDEAGALVDLELATLNFRFKNKGYPAKDAVPVKIAPPVIGECTYSTLSSDLDVAGCYTGQVTAVIGTRTYPTSKFDFTVENIIPLN